jgi:hypothetical protein
VLFPRSKSEYTSSSTKRMNWQREIGRTLTRSRPKKWSTGGSSSSVTPGQLWREPPLPIAPENGRWIPAAAAKNQCFRQRRHLLDQNAEARRWPGRRREENHGEGSPPSWRFRTEREGVGGARVRMGKNRNPNCLRTTPGWAPLVGNVRRRNWG